MSCGGRVVSPCTGGDGSPCEPADIATACVPEYICDNLITEVPQCILSFTGTNVWLAWLGVNIGDELEVLVKNTDTNDIIYLGSTVDVELGTFGSLDLGGVPVVGNYMSAIRRIEGDYAGPWTTCRAEYTGTGYTIIIDGSSIVTDGSTTIIDT